MSASTAVHPQKIFRALRASVVLQYTFPKHIYCTGVQASPFACAPLLRWDVAPWALFTGDFVLPESPSIMYT